MTLPSLRTLGKRYLTILTAACCTTALCGHAAGVAAEEDSSKKPVGFYYDPGGHRDPFVPLVRDGRLVGMVKPGGSAGPSQPTLYGILWDPKGQSIALINDGEAKLGDTIAGYQVKEIRKDAVVLSNGGEALVLQISFDAPQIPAALDTPTGGKSR